MRKKHGPRPVRNSGSRGARARWPRLALKRTSSVTSVQLERRTSKGCGSLKSVWDPRSVAELALALEKRSSDATHVQGGHRSDTCLWAGRDHPRKRTKPILTDLVLHRIFRLQVTIMAHALLSTLRARSNDRKHVRSILTVVLHCTKFCGATKWSSLIVDPQPGVYEETHMVMAHPPSSARRLCRLCSRTRHWLDVFAMKRSQYRCRFYAACKP